MWLYTGALAASLTYSGTAAIHACLLIWSGPSWGELDLVALLAILTTSCLVAVPLLNWFSMLRRSDKDDEKKFSQTTDELPRELNASSDLQVAEATRLVLVCWSFLVFVALISLVLALTGQLVTRYHNKVFVLWNVWAYPSPSKIICTPSSGQMNFTAGQRDSKDGHIGSFQLSKEFLSENNCLNPCGTPLMGNAIFRGDEDLVPVPLFLNDDVGPSLYYKPQQIDKKLQAGFVNGGLTIIFFIIAQGIWAIICGPRSPAEVRARLYRYITRVKSRGRPKSGASQWRQVLAKYLAMWSYTYSIVTALVSIPLLALTILAVEGFLQYLPQNESEIHVGAWSPWANTGLILIAAFISRFHATFRRLARLEFWIRRKSTIRMRGYRSSRCEALLQPVYHIWRVLFILPWNYISDKVSEITRAIREEWEETKSFWEDPERFCSVYGEATETSEGEENDRTGLPSINRVSGISMTEFGLPRSPKEEGPGEEEEGDRLSAHSDPLQTSV